MNTIETSIETFLSYLYSLDVKLWIEGAETTSDEGVRLRCNAPETVLTPDLSAQISARKPEIIGFLQQTQAALRPSTEGIQPFARPNDVPLSFAQQRLWFLDQMEPGSPLYNIPAAARFIGELNTAVLERSFNEIVRRHEALRTAFQAVDGQPIQRIAADSALTLRHIDLSTLPKAEQEAQVLRWSNQEAQQPFDLTQGPLLRVTLIRLHDTEHVALLTMHHIISDAWSMGVLMRELTALYPAFLTGRPSPLPELPIQYADFTLWQRRRLQGETLDKHLYSKRLKSELS